MRVKKETESDLLNSICEWLEIKHLIFFRVNNIPVFDATQRIFRKMPKYSVKGVADLCILKDGTSWWLEVKLKTGRQSPNQKEFEDMVLRSGNHYFLVKSIDDLEIIFGA